MLSRRNVRIKVMQQLYSLNQDKELTFKDIKSAYRHSLLNAFHLYLLNLYSIIKVCSFAVEDATNRKKKHLKSEEDLKFSDKLYTNPLVKSLATNPFLQKRLKADRIGEGIDEDIFRKIYKEFTKEEKYVKYIMEDDTSSENLVELLLELYRVCRRNELFNEIMDDHYSGWPDDKSLVIGAVKKTLKVLPSQADFISEHLPDDETVTEFGETLLDKTFQSNSELDQLIKPVLVNWEAERIAIIDLILIKMAITEMVNIKTIPPKVTLNEYVELAKMYSTDKSQEFVNGVLDRLLKGLQEENKIIKEGRGLLD
ncbi:MAG: transcription antitermination factor NusB [Saprospiraceae bacterium]|nr:transcription antitermination factor NusB [Saprospiraceae bacterium]HMW38844.1 transcription antitermination factor NusB [Saprospiraceae bacterium]HMX87837.1 transcription antitermination factor NusB [Saprospiraceae bacterium]HMZ39685.1 transcription antitermination factor NusB [Saprospiraceae bacterium]HNA64221.1 transcription antitermination factor NusB [Saprospiraceae bacterium]